MKHTPPDGAGEPAGPAGRNPLETLLESGLLETLADAAPVAVMAVDTEGRMTFWNRAAEEIFGWRAEEVLGRPNPIVPGPKTQEFHRFLQDTLSGRPVRGAKLERRRKDGSSVWIRLSNAPLLDADGRAWGAIAVAEDISEGVKARRRLDRVGRALRARAALAAAVIGAESEEELFEAACRAAVEEAGYRMAWVGLAHDDPERRVIPAVKAGFEAGYLEGTRITWDESPSGRGPTGTAIRTGRPAVARNIEHDPRFSPWREDALSRGYRSSAALPLVTDTGVLGALNLYAPEPHAFDDEELELLGGLAQDLSLAVTAKRRVRESEERYRLAFHTSPDAVNINRLEDGVYVDINEGFTRITGYSREDVLGRSSLELHIWANPEDRDRLVAQLRSEGAVRNLEAPFRMKDGSLRTGLMSAVVIVLGGEPHILSITRDITERVAAEAALRASEARFSGLFESSPVSLWEEDASQLKPHLEALAAEHGDDLRDWLEEHPEEVAYCASLLRIIDVNEATLELFGAGAKEELFAGLDRTFGPEATQVFREELVALAGGATAFERDGVVYRTPRGPIHTKLNLSLAPGAEADWSRVHVAISDLTDLIAAEQSLAEAGRQWQATFDAMIDPVFLLDREQRVQRANHAAGKLLSRPEAELPGELCYELVHGTDCPIERCPVVRMFATGESERLEVELDGRWFVITADPLRDLTGAITGAVHTFRDITDRKQAEEKLKESEETYRNLFHNAQVGLFRTRIEDGKILESNDQLANMFGYENRNEFINEYITSDNYVDLGTREKMLEIVTEKGEINNYEARFYRKDRSIFWANYSARVYPEKGWIEGVAEDITDRKQAEEALQRLNEELEERVAERTAELRRAVDLMAGRELRMAELKEVIKALRRQLEEAGSTPVADDPLLESHGSGETGLSKEEHHE